MKTFFSSFKSQSLGPNIPKLFKMTFRTKIFIEICSLANICQHLIHASGVQVKLQPQQYVPPHLDEGDGLLEGTNGRLTTQQVLHKMDM